MLEYKDALEIMLSSAIVMPTEKVELHHSLNRILAENVISDMDMPPFNKSAMDGFACRNEDLNNELEVVETIYAGKQPEKQIQKNQCYKIMTGAVVPDDADIVFKKEDAEFHPDGKVKCTNPSTGNNICYRGEDVKKGQLVLQQSVLITPRHLPALAGAGVTKPLVFGRPRISVMTTGTELVEPHQKPLPFQIRNSNSAQLIAQLKNMEIEATYGGIWKDEKDLIRDKMERAFSHHDVVILTGGVSVGDYDFIPEILKELGFEILVSSTAIKPGKPISFARKKDKYCFGLSGNPVSSFVQFELYVKPFLYKMMGHDYKPVILNLPMGVAFHRKIADRINLIPANINQSMKVVPVEFHGSAHINALSDANFLLEVPKNAKTLNKGDLVNVRQI